MEKKEIVDQSGITFKGLLIVFKRIWYLLLALVVVCGAGYTLFDDYAHRSQKYYYTSTARMKVADIDVKGLSEVYDIVRAYLTHDVLIEDVVGKTIASNTDNTSSGRDFLYVDEIEYTNGNVVKDSNQWRWGISMSSNILPYFTISLTSYSMTPKQVQVTLQQICRSLINVLGSTETSTDATSYLDGKIIIDKEAYLPVTPGEYSNPSAPIIGVAIGLILSVAIVLLVYKLDDSVKSKEELERLTGVMFITYIEDIGDIKGGSKK